MRPVQPKQAERALFGDLAFADSICRDGGMNACSARIDTAVTSKSFDSMGGRMVLTGHRPSAAWRRCSQIAWASVAASGG